VSLISSPGPREAGLEVHGVMLAGVLLSRKGVGVVGVFSDGVVSAGLLSGFCCVFFGTRYDLRKLMMAD